jgi:hypothetical protein
MTNLHALALAVLSTRVEPTEVFSALRLAEALCNVLDPLSDDEIKHTATPTLAERIIAEHNRILKEERP